MSSARRLLCTLALCLPLVAGAAQSSPWQSDFDAFAAADLRMPPARGGVVFVGSSSIRLWPALEQAFERFPAVLQRGFGGSTMNDCAEHVERLVLAYAPRTVVLYAGENDLAAGAAPAAVLASVQRFVERVRQEHPGAHLAYVSIKPSPLRAALLPSIQATNALVRDYFAGLANAQFVDVHAAMLDGEGRPRGELFGPDRLHMNAAGYALWRQELNARLP